MEKTVTKEVQERRKANYDIDHLFLNRWSPRSMTGEALIEDEFMPLFEAARWAPSSYNSQQWRFLYAKRNSKEWNTFLDLLVEGNKGWAKNAALLVVVISRKNFEHNEKPSRTHVFDAGAAWENLALEGAQRGLVVHGMEGFDYDKAKKILGVPDNYDVCAMIAIGKRGKKENLPSQLQEIEQPNDRRPLHDIAIEGRFRGK
ncbi:nitroreductase family protein [Candidatus Woesearchaeota archaeon]|nr:nitroreductase family protein [Candidatus Woesearchaeota archaeon]